MTIINKTTHTKKRKKVPYIKKKKKNSTPLQKRTRPITKITETVKFTPVPFRFIISIWIKIYYTLLFKKKEFC